MRQILLAVDGSEGADVAAHHAIDFARFSGASIEGLHVIGPGALPAEDESVEMTDVSAHMEDEEKLELTTRTGEQLLDEVRVWAQEAQVPFLARVERGETAGRILFHSDMCDITVMGAQGENAHPSRLLGSTTSRVALDAIRPVLVTRGSYRPFRRVLIAYNRTDGAADALTFAARWAHAAQWELTLVTGADYEPDGEQLIAQAKRFLANWGVHANSRVSIPGDGTQAVFHATQDLQPDLILIGSRGRGSVARLLLGSTSKEVLEQSPCSVMIFR
jgi:nucleotide-binding universal stress UspA family protein